MPPSKPSNLPSKKRRASSATASIEETIAKEKSQSAQTDTTKEQAEPAHDNPPTAGAQKNKISPSRLPSKKRKGSHDSSLRSVKSGQGEREENSMNVGVDSKENASKAPKSEPTTDLQDQLVSEDKTEESKPQSKLSSVKDSIEASPGRSRINSADSTGALGLRKFSDTLSSPGSSPNRVRLRSGSHVSIEIPGLPRLRSGSHDSFTAPPKQRLRSGSHTSLDSTTRQRLRSGSTTSIDSLTRQRLRSGSITSLDDPFARRKWSHDMGALDIFAPDRKGSQDTTHSIKLDVLLQDLPPPEPININPKMSEFDMNEARPRSNSTASLVSTTGAIGGGGALEHLDALGEDAKPAAKERKNSAGSADDHSSAADTFGSSGHRILAEAIKLTTGETDITSKTSSPEPSLQPRGRLESWGVGIGGRERFESLGSALEAAALASTRRDRLESWGGMSELSITFGDGTAGGSSSAAAAAAAAAVAVAEQFELAGGVEDFALLGDLDGAGRQRTSSIPSRISLDRNRFNSIASFSEASFLPDGTEMTIDLNSIVQAAMAHVGDLAELAGIVETVARTGEDREGKEADASEASSVASPMIGAAVEGGGHRQRPRSWSTSSKISVDYEALAAAVDAAQAAAGNIDLDNLGAHAMHEDWSSGTSGEGRSRKARDSRRRRQLPLKRDRSVSEILMDEEEFLIGEEERAMSAQVDETEMNRIRKRARMAASKKTPPTDNEKASARKKQSVPIKKRGKRQNSPPRPDAKVSSGAAPTTPRVSNKAIAAADEFPDNAVSSVEKSSSKGQASQKWDSMFDALLCYIEEKRQEETTDFSEEEKKEWSWDGNVPTTYKSPDGKALGRWVNNQRSAKSKGTLKGDREERLVQAGLKWSVMASNCWNETLEELRSYIKDQTKDGKEWDGNVPTHYQIKAKPNGKFAGEDKNLGRWVNRQRSLFQAGKLRKDRQIALEKIGLKWSMLSSTSWEGMFETLQEYVKERKAKEGSWDGNVPANHRTTDDPPRALGRWINRQRSAHTKGKLKAEYVEKLNEIGLKWSVHEKNGGRSVQDDGEDDNDSYGEEEATPAKAAQLKDPPALATARLNSNAQASATHLADKVISKEAPAINAEAMAPEKAASNPAVEENTAAVSEPTPAVQPSPLSV
eukprot:scaffold1314_cov158-Amphora_coffeaeformis.AAC.19